MALIAKTSTGEMPPRSISSWRAGLLEDNRSEQAKRAEEGDLDALAMQKMVNSIINKPGHT